MQTTPRLKGYNFVSIANSPKQVRVGVLSTIWWWISFLCEQDKYWIFIKTLCHNIHIISIQDFIINLERTWSICKKILNLQIQSRNSLLLDLLAFCLLNTSEQLTNFLGLCEKWLGLAFHCGPARWASLALPLPKSGKRHKLWKCSLTSSLFWLITSVPTHVVGDGFGDKLIPRSRFSTWKTTHKTKNKLLLEPFQPRRPQPMCIPGYWMG